MVGDLAEEFAKFCFGFLHIRMYFEFYHSWFDDVIDCDCLKLCTLFTWLTMSLLDLELFFNQLLLMPLPVAPVVLLTNVAVPAESWFPPQTHTSSMIPWIWAVLIISTPDHRLVLILPHAFWA